MNEEDEEKLGETCGGLLGSVEGQHSDMYVLYVLYVLYVRYVCRYVTYLHNGHCSPPLGIGDVAACESNHFIIQ